MNRSIAFILAALLPAYALAQEAPKKSPPDEKKAPLQKVTVPFELIKTQHMVVSVKVNGKGPYRLVFDTGAPDSLISNKVAKEAEVYDKAHKKPFLSLFGPMGQIKIKEIDVGNLKANNVSAQVLDHPTVQAIANFVGPIEGILGFTFYSRYKMSIDYEKKLLTLEPNDYVPGDVMKKMIDRLSSPDAKKAPVLAPAGQLGIRVGKEASDEGVKSIAMRTSSVAGVTVRDVLPDTAAASAGFKAGDRLLTLDGRWTDTLTDCYLAAMLLRPGTTVEAVVLRDGEKLTLKISPRAGL